MEGPSGPNVAPAVSHYVAPGENKADVAAAIGQACDFVISQVPVTFPFPPYKSQVAMMSAILKSIVKGTNALLESPTGSGKSLALLCASVAWQEKEQARLDEVYFAEVREYDAWLDQQNKNAMAKIDAAHGIGQQPDPVVKATGDGARSRAPPKRKSKESATDDSEYVEASGSRKNRRLTAEDSDSEDDFVDTGSRSSAGTQKRKPFRPASLKARPPKSSKDQSSAASASTDNRASSTDHQPMKGIATSRKVMKKPKRGKAPTLYFGSRTHKQLAQLISELRSTKYGARARMAVLSSRDHTCINEKLKNTSKNEGCERLLEEMGQNKGGGCRHFHRVRQLVSHRDLQPHGRRSVWDLEDLVELGQTTGGCPFFAAREIAETAQIVFCPYNYVVDPVIREQLGINVKDSIVILDEAHNIEDTSRDSVSLSLTVEDLLEIVEDLSMLLDVKFEVDLVEDLHSILNQLGQWLERVGQNDLTKTSFECSSKVFSTLEMQRELTDLGLIPATVEILQEQYENLRKALSDQEASKSKRKKNPKLRGSVALNLQRFLVVMGLLLRDGRGHLTDYSLVVEKKAVMKKSRGRGVARAKKESVLTMNLWCLNPSVAFSMLSETRSIILTSGTLSPLDSFASELGVAFPYRLEANHVVSKSQVWAQPISRGPSGKELVATFENTDTIQFKDDVGNLVDRVCQTVPFGVLLFVPSYRLLDSLCKRWQQTKIWSSISKKKVIICEPRGGDKDEFQSRMEKFYNVIKKLETGGRPGGLYPSVDGALFIAVCRGKVSEGLDFADNNARAVISIGIPFPSSKDPQVKLKKQYNDKHRSSKRPLLSGSEWYATQAFRAINQGLGRCLRHRSDWGALLIVDARFKKQRNVAGLSKWIRSFLRPTTSFDTMLESLEAFVQSHTEPSASLPSVEPEKLPEIKSKGRVTSPVTKQESESIDISKSGTVQTKPPTPAVEIAATSVEQQGRATEDTMQGISPRKHLLSQETAQALLEDMDTWPSTPDAPSSPPLVLRCTSCTNELIEAAPDQFEAQSISDSSVSAFIPGKPHAADLICSVAEQPLILDSQFVTERHFDCTFSDSLGCCFGPITCNTCEAQARESIVGVRLLATTAESSLRCSVGTVWLFVHALLKGES